MVSTHRPNSLYADHSDPSEQIHRLDHGGEVSRLRIFPLVLSSPRCRADELEAVHGSVAYIQYCPFCLGFCRLVTSAGDAAK